MNKNVKIAKELVKLAKSLVASKSVKASATFKDADSLAKALLDFANGDYSNFAGEMPSGKWFCVEYGREGDEEYWVCYLNAQVYDDLEPKGFMFEFLGEVPCGTATLEDCQDIAKYAFTCDSAKFSEYSEFTPEDFYKTYLDKYGVDMYYGDEMSSDFRDALQTRTKEVIAEVDKVGRNVWDALRKVLPELEKKWYLEYCANSIKTDYTGKEKQVLEKNIGKFADWFEDGREWRDLMYEAVDGIFDENGLND